MDRVELVPEVTYAAIGALAGVLLTVMVQALNSYLQRRSEHILNTYETKLEIFADFLTAIDNLSTVASYVKNLKANADLQAFRAAKKKIGEAQAIVEGIERELTSEPPPSPHIATVVRERARDEVEQIQAAVDLVTQMAPRMSRLSDELAEKEESLDEVQAEVKRLRFKLLLVADDKTIGPSLKRLVERIRARETIDSSDYSDFITAAAKQVGIR